MKSGVYRHRTQTDLQYLFVGLAKDHDTHDVMVIYIPLFNRDEWKGQPVMTYRKLENFEKNFEWVSDKHPS